jgi:putative peptide zinc metalloprotease protein
MSNVELEPTGGIAPGATVGLDVVDGFQFDSVQRNSNHVLLERKGGYIRLSPSAWDLIQAVRSGATFEELAQLLNDRPTADPVSKEQLEQAYRELLGKLTEMSQKEPRKGLPWGFWLRLRLLPRSVVGWIASRLTFLYQPLLAACLTVIVIAVLAGMYSGRIPVGMNRSDILPAYLLFLLSLFIHEFGHAAASKRYGAEPSEIGIALYLIYPAFYADVSSAWQLSRWKRVIVDLGGAYFQLLAGCVFLLMFYLTGWQPPRLAFLMILYTSLFSLNPIFRFDGYWVMADLLDVPNLSRQPGRIIGHFFKRLFGRQTPLLPWPKWLLAIMVLYAAASVFVWGSFLLRLVPSFQASLSDSFRLVRLMALTVLSGKPPAAADVRHLFFTVFMLAIFVVTLAQLAKRLLGSLVQRIECLWKERKSWAIFKGA